MANRPTRRTLEALGWWFSQCDTFPDEYVVLVNMVMEAIIADETKAMTEIRLANQVLEESAQKTGVLFTELFAATGTRDADALVVWVKKQAGKAK